MVKRFMVEEFGSRACGQGSEGLLKSRITHQERATM